MDVFICWSGRSSERVATALHAWLADVIQDLRPFMSHENIRKGARWRNDIAEKLDATKFGIICLTATNLTSPWILFEAGALSKNIKENHVTALLLGIKATDVLEPLSEFQHTFPSKDEMEKLIGQLNGLLPLERQIDAVRLKRAFELHWPQLEQEIEDALKSDNSLRRKPPERQTNEMITEV